MKSVHNVSTLTYYNIGHSVTVTTQMHPSGDCDAINHSSVWWWVIDIVGIAAMLLLGEYY